MQALRRDSPTSQVAPCLGSRSLLAPLVVTGTLSSETAQRRSLLCPKGSRGRKNGGSITSRCGKVLAMAKDVAEETQILMPLKICLSLWYRCLMLVRC